VYVCVCGQRTLAILLLRPVLLVVVDRLQRLRPPHEGILIQDRFSTFFLGLRCPGEHVLAGDESHNRTVGEVVGAVVVSGTDRT
jgi:hypothetical protein